MQFNSSIPASFRLFLRCAYAATGILLSAIPFLIILAAGIVLYGVSGALQGRSVIDFFLLTLRTPGTRWVVGAAVVFVTYWPSVVFLIVQFARGHPLSPHLSVFVGVVLVSTLLITQPWFAAKEPLTLGIESLGHAAFVLSLLAIAYRQRSLN